MLLSLKSKGSATRQHLVNSVSIVCEGERENPGFQHKSGIPGSAPLAADSPGELRWLVGSEPISPWCQKAPLVLS